MDILITKRLTLRPPLEVDAEAISAEFQNRDITRNLSGPPHPYTLQDAQEWIEREQKRTDSLNYTLHRNRLIGMVSVRKVDDVFDLGFWLAQSHWGHGYMTEAARAVLAVAFRHFGCSEIHSGAVEDNSASLRVQEKLGFEPNGVQDETFPARDGETAPCQRTLLTRTAFETLFGSLEADQAA